MATTTRTSTVLAAVTYDAETHTLHCQEFPANEARSGDVYRGPRDEAAIRDWADEQFNAPFQDEDGTTFGDYSDAVVVWN